MSTFRTKGCTTRWSHHTIFLLVGVLVLAFTHSAQAQGWAPRADMPSARGYLGGSVVNGQIYLFGGSLDESGNDPTRTRVEVYAPATDTWRRKADIPLLRITAAAATLDDQIYVVGASSFGDGGLELLVYAPATDTWSRKADLPIERRHMAAAVVDGKFYTIGGGVEDVGYLGSPSVFMYDPDTDAWSARADLPKSGIWLLDGACTVDGKIYVLGISAETFESPSSAMYMYDPTTDTWSQKADMPTMRKTLATAVVADKIYAIGGSSGPPFLGDQAVVEVYDPATDTWSTEAVPPLANARSGAVAAAVEGTIYVFGGWTGFKASLTSVEAFDTGTGSTAIEAWGWGGIKASIDRSPVR